MVATNTIFTEYPFIDDEVIELIRIPVIGGGRES